MGNMQAHHVLNAMQLDMFQFMGTADKGFSEAVGCN
jgi:hypothetical protein